METKQDRLRMVLSNQATRVAYFEHDLYLYGQYHFAHLLQSKSPSYHKKWARAFQSGDHTAIKAYRGSGKTVWLTIYYAWVICYKKRRFITHYCYEQGNAENRLFDLIIQLQTSQTIRADYGMLYSESRTKDEKKKSGISEFITTNYVMVKAMSLGTSPRGMNYIAPDGSYRPDLVGLDDIDVQKSVTNKRIIDKNENFITGELIGGISSNAQIILLGNVIKKDGVVPRIEEAHRNDNDWHLFQEAIYRDGEITWTDRYVETDEEAQATGKESIAKIKRAQGSKSFAQNYLLVPSSDEDSIIRHEHIRYGFREGKIVIGVDPAFSTKTLSDNFAIGVVSHGETGKCVRAVYALAGKDKDHNHAIDFVYKIYKETGAVVVNFESVAAQTVLAKMLRAKGVNVSEVRPHADKVTRVGEIQPQIESGEIVFDKDWPGISEAIEEMTDFPNGVHDDRVDAIIYASISHKVYEPYFW